MQFSFFHLIRFQLKNVTLGDTILNLIQFNSLHQLEISESSDEERYFSIYSRARQHARDVSFHVESFLGLVSKQLFLHPDASIAKLEHKRNGAKTRNLTARKSFRLIFRFFFFLARTRRCLYNVSPSLVKRACSQVNSGLELTAVKHKNLTPRQAFASWNFLRV